MQAAKPKPKPKPAGRPPRDDIYPGKVFGRLTILGKVHTKEGLFFRWECKCGVKGKCPRQHLVRVDYPKTHCGCQAYINANPYKYEKVCWNAMHLRCEYVKHVSYKDYGGRGITIDPRWSKSLPNNEGFKNFVVDIGPCPKPHEMTVDRKNPNGNYTKDNCKWATKKEQANNQRRHYKPEPEAT